MAQCIVTDLVTEAVLDLGMIWSDQNSGCQNLGQQMDNLCILRRMCNAASQLCSKIPVENWLPFQHKTSCAMQPTII